MKKVTIESLRFRRMDIEREDVMYGNIKSKRSM